MMETLKDLLKSQTDQNYIEIIRGLEVLTERTDETRNHLYRVSVFSCVLGIMSGLNHNEITEIFFASRLHDLGKIFIPPHILSKPGKLTVDEMNIVKTHSLKGFRILDKFNHDLIKKAAIISLEHHEKWNGEGYPNGKKGEEINKFARIVAVADVFDALLSKRCYKDAWSKEEVKNFFIEENGKSFDPQVCEVFLDNFDTFYNLRELAFVETEKKKEAVQLKEIFSFVF